MVYAAFSKGSRPQSGMSQPGREGVNHTVTYRYGGTGSPVPHVPHPLGAGARLSSGLER